MDVHIHSVRETAGINREEWRSVYSPMSSVGERWHLMTPFDSTSNLAVAGTEITHTLIMKIPLLRFSLFIVKYTKCVKI